MVRIGTWDSEAGHVLVVAEIGNNHEGSFDTAVKLVQGAARAGADAVKFQTFDADFFITRADRTRYDRYRRFELSHREFRELAGVARDLGLLFVSTPFDLASARYLAEFVDALKIASSDNTFRPLLDEVVATDLPLIVSTGLLDLDEVRSLVTWYRQQRARDDDPGLAVLHCVTSYPVPEDQANVAAVRTLARELDVTVGYSDHTRGVDAAVLAVGCGARIIEKHFTLDHEFSGFRDHQLSADPPELQMLVERVRAAERLLGDGIKRMMACEQGHAEAVRRSIAAARDLPSGTVLTAADLTWVRPGTGMPPGRENEVIGRTLSRATPKGHLIDLAALEKPQA